MSLRVFLFHIIIILSIHCITGRMVRIKTEKGNCSLYDIFISIFEALRLWQIPSTYWKVEPEDKIKLYILYEMINLIFFIFLLHRANECWNLRWGDGDREEISRLQCSPWECRQTQTQPQECWQTQECWHPYQGTRYKTWRLQFNPWECWQTQTQSWECRHLYWGDEERHKIWRLQFWSLVQWLHCDIDL